MTTGTTPPAVPDEPCGAHAGRSPAPAESWTPEQVAEFKASFEAAMAKYAPLRVLPSDHWKDRAEAAEAKLARVEELAGQLVTATHPTIGGTFAASIGHKFLAAIGTEEGAAFARQLIAQAEAADAGYKVAAVRAALYTFLHQYGRSELPTFKVAIDLAVSLRKIVDDLGGEEEARDG